MSWRWGFGVLLAALFIVAELWLIPFSPDDYSYYTQTCIPIREALRHHPAGFPMGFDRCNYHSVQRVEIGAVVGGGLAILGLTMFFASWRSRQIANKAGARAVGD